MAALAMFLASHLDHAVRGLGSPDDLEIRLMTFQLAIATLIAVIVTGVHRQVWRHSNARDIRRIVQAAILANLIVMPLGWIAIGQAMAMWTTYVLAAGIQAVLMILGRLVSRARATGQALAAFRPAPSNGPNAILVGEAADIADILATLAKSRDGFPIRPLGIIETGDEHRGRAIGGIQVLGGLDVLDHFMTVFGLRFDGAPWIALAGAPKDRATMDAVLEIAERHGATIQRLRRNGDAGVAPVRPADLLSRPERKLDERLVANLISGARVFVTGAGGTIGSELVRQCAALGPAEISLFEASEYNLYDIDMQLRDAFPNIERRAMLGDVRNRARLEEAINACKPDVVIHAAALKHVPLMETNPNEAILTNILGTRNAAELAAAAGARAFVQISTDKAVTPANIMGATKRAAELFLQAFAPTQPHMAISMVRFGNVLGSTGSVAPLFEHQIARGGPVTVTHRDMTRFFMSVEEAAALVLQAAALGVRSNGAKASLYVLDMGEPVAIMDLAERMIRLKGLRPYIDVPISVTGLRPGEKLTERVFYTEEDVADTEIDGVLLARTPKSISLAELNQRPRQSD